MTLHALDLSAADVHRSGSMTVAPIQAAAILIVWDADHARVLTISRPEPPREQALPGGHVEPDETPEQAAVREVAEECGVTVTAPRYLCALGSPVDGRPVLVFEATAFTGTPSALESDTTPAWLTPSDLLAQATLFAPTLLQLAADGHLPMTERVALISAEKRKDLPTGKFALPSLRKYPVDTAARTRNAAARLEQMHKDGKIADVDYEAAKKRIAAAAKKFGIESEFAEGSSAARRAPMAPGRLHVSIDHPQHGHFEIRHNRDGSSTFRQQSIPLLPSSVEGDAPVWVQISTRGTFAGHGAGKFTLDDATFRDIVRNYKDVDLGQVHFDYEHSSEQDPTDGTIPTSGAPAQAWILDLRIEPDGLHALVEWLEPAKTQVREKKYKFVSPAIRFGSKHPVTGANIGARLTSVALTNSPFLRGLQPLTAKDTDMDVTLSSTLAFGSHEFMPKIRACLGMHELSTPAECSERMQSLSDLYKASGGESHSFGVPVGEYVDRLRDAMRVPMTSTVESLFSDVGTMLDAAAQEQMDMSAGMSAQAAENDEMSDAIALKDVTTKLTAAEAHTVTLTSHLKDATTKLSSAEGKLVTAEGQVATLTLQLNEKGTKVSALEAEIVRLKDEGDKRDAAELAARVDEAFETHKDAQKLTENHKKLMLSSAKADRPAFDAVYPRIGVAERHLLRALVTPADGTGGTREGVATDTNAGADAVLMTETRSETALRLIASNPKLSVTEAINEAVRLHSAGR